MPAVLTRLRKLCLGLPAAHEVEAWGAPTFRVKNKLFAMFAAASDHHGGGRNGVWLKTSAINQQLMLKAAPDRFFFPPYVGKSGWIGVWLDSRTKWGELKEMLADAHASIAPKRLLTNAKPTIKRPKRR